MRSLVYFVATSADGFIARPDGSVDGFPFSGSHIDAMAAELPETLPAAFRDHLGLTGASRFDTVLEGRATHQIGLDAGVADAYPHLRHFVFSSTLESVHPSIELVRTNALERVLELKAEPGRDIWLCGGGRLAAALLPAIDEITLKINPLVLGDGIPVIDGASADLDLVASRPFDSGVVWLTYRPRG